MPEMVMNIWMGTEISPCTGIEFKSDKVIFTEIFFSVSKLGLKISMVEMALSEARETVFRCWLMGSSIIMAESDMNRARWWFTEGALTRPPVRALAEMLMGRSELVAAAGEETSCLAGRIKAKARAAAAAVGTTHVNLLMFFG